jgi:hypothetical protein
MPILAILEEQCVRRCYARRDHLSLNWEDLSVLPTRWKYVLSQWRGIHYIFDTSDGKDYIGFACGGSNLLGRWLDKRLSNRELRL